MSDGVFLAVIPARGGSKGIPRKNLALLDGKPLIAHALDAARGARSIADHVVSTDAEEIARVVTDLGGNALYPRPAVLASDTAPTLGVVQHALKWWEQKNGRMADAVVLLQPTTPLRSAADVDAAVDLYRGSAGASSLISVTDAVSHHPRVLYRQHPTHDWRLAPWVADSAGMRRQDFEPVYRRNGAIYIAARTLIMEGQALLTEDPLFYVMPEARSVNIDTLDDLAWAGFLVCQGRGTTS